MIARAPGRPLLPLLLVAVAAPASAEPPAPAAPAASPAAAAPTPAAPAATPAAGKDREQRKRDLAATVLSGVKRVPGYRKVKLYTAPPPPAEVDPPIEPSDVLAVEATDENEALVLVHPTISPLLGAVARGTRAPVKGVVKPRSPRGCSTRLWYALDPFGYVCSKSVRPTTQPPTREPFLRVVEGDRVPFHYVMVGVKDGEPLPMWATLEAVKAGDPPERMLERGDTVAIEKTVRLDGTAHYLSVEGKVLPVKGTYSIDAQISPWRGEALTDKTHFPFGWVTPDVARVWPEPATRGKPTATSLARRTRVDILEDEGTGRKRMLRVGEGMWVRAVDVNEVRPMARPEGITPAAQWIDVDVGEQVLVAYEGERPVFATLVSSGRAIPTPRGSYPVWAKVSAISMKSQPYEDKAYFVNKVPWVLFFQAHNAIHGAYWHDRFGVSKSHGCVNVAPLDARHLFEWAAPSLPAGWTGYRAHDLLGSATVRVRNSHAKVELVQERPIGPPDKELEALKLEEAEERRAAVQGLDTVTVPTAP